MEASEELLNNLILSTCHLCDRVRELAHSDSKHPAAVAPVREATRMVEKTLEALSATMATDIGAALPKNIAEDWTEIDWLLGDAPAESLEERDEA